MAKKLALGLEITADPEKAKAGLAETRHALLSTYADAKASVAQFNTALEQSQAKAQAMAREMGTMGPPTRAMVAEFEKAKAAVNQAESAVQKKTLAMQQARVAAQQNAEAIAGVAAAATRAAAASTSTRQLAAAQAMIDAENQLQREIMETAAARQSAAATAAAAARAEASRPLAARNMANSASMGSIGLRDSSSIRGEMAEANRAVAALKANGAAAQDIARASQAAQARLAALNAELNGTAAAGNAAQGSLAGAAHRMVAMAAAALAAREAIQLLKSSVETGVKFDSLKSQYAFGNGGDTKKAADEMAFAAQLSNRLGLELLGTTQAYGKLQAASRGSVLQGQATRDIFTAVASAGAVMGLTAEVQSGALLAISQMMSKGTISAEELRGQLGERLPGAFQIAASAMKMTEAELGKMLETGQLTATQFLPRFADALQASVNGALPAAEATARANLQRLENAFTEFKLRIANSGLMDKVAEQLERLLTHIGNMADSGELDKLATGFANAFGSAIKFMADAAILAERFSGVLIPLAEGLAAVMVGGRALALLGAAAPGISAVGAATATVGTASAGAAVGVGVLSAAMRLIPGFAVGAALLFAAEKLIEWGAKAAEAREKTESLEASLRKLIDTTSEHAGKTRLDADALGEFDDKAFAKYQEEINKARDYAAAKVVDLTQDNKNGRFDKEIAQYREQAAAYNEFIDTVLAKEVLRRNALQMTGRIAELEAKREKQLAGEVTQTRAEKIAEQIKGYESLVEAIRKAREEAQKEAEEARKKAGGHREKADDLKTAAGDKATSIREKGLTEEERQAADRNRATEAQSEGAYLAARAGVAQLEGRGKDFEKYTNQAEKFLSRAMQFAEKSGDANLIEDIGKGQSDLEKTRAKSEDKKAGDADQQAANLMTLLNDYQGKIKELKGEAATIQINAEIADAVSKLSEVEGKLAALQDKTVTVTVNTVDSEASKAPADTTKMSREELIDAIPARADGGRLPGTAPHPRADNMLYWGTPGEWVIRNMVTAQPGAHDFLNDFNAQGMSALKRWAPGYADGGRIGNSIINRLSIPSVPPSAGQRSNLAPANLHLDGKSYPVQAAPDVIGEVKAYLARKALSKGGRR